MNNEDMSNQVKAVLESIDLTKRERDALQTENQELKIKISRLQGENDMLSMRNTELKVERDAYMRSVTELMTGLSNANALINDHLQKAKTVPYRNNGQIKRDEELTDLQDMARRMEGTKTITYDKEFKKVIKEIEPPWPDTKPVKSIIGNFDEK